MRSPLACATARPADDSASALSAAGGAPKHAADPRPAPRPPSAPPPALIHLPALQQQQQYAGHLMLLDIDAAPGGPCHPASPGGSPSQAAGAGAGAGAFTPPSDYMERADRTLFFARVSSTATAHELHAAFAAYGPVEEVNLFRAWPTAKVSKGCGLVVMATAAGASAAIEGLDKKFAWDGADGPMVVERCDPARLGVKAANAAACKAERAAAAAAAAARRGGAGAAGRPRSASGPLPAARSPLPPAPPRAGRGAAGRGGGAPALRFVPVFSSDDHLPALSPCSEPIPLPELRSGGYVLRGGAGAPAPAARDASGQLVFYSTPLAAAAPGVLNGAASGANGLYADGGGGGGGGAAAVYADAGSVVYAEDGICDAFAGPGPLDYADAPPLAPNRQAAMSAPEPLVWGVQSAAPPAPAGSMAAYILSGSMATSALELAPPQMQQQLPPQQLPPQHPHLQLLVLQQQQLAARLEAQQRLQQQQARFAAAAPPPAVPPQAPQAPQQAQRQVMLPIGGGDASLLTAHIPTVELLSGVSLSVESGSIQSPGLGCFAGQQQLFLIISGTPPQLQSASTLLARLRGGDGASSDSGGGSFGLGG